MSDVDELQLAVRRGVKAAAMLADPLFNDVLAKVADDAIALWRSAIGPGLTAVRERCHATVYGVDQVRAELSLIEQAGTLAKQKLDDPDE